MQNNILYIYNPVAGKGKAGDELAKVIETLSDKGFRITVRPTSSGLTPEMIIAQEKNNNFDIILCSGGDGTLNHTITGMFNELPRPFPFLAYIPAGSINDFANSVGIPKNTIENCNNIAQLEEFYYDIGKFGDKYFNYAAGFGYFTSLSYSAPQELKNIIGHSAYYLEALRHIPIGEKYHAKITLPEQIIEDDFALCIISNSFRVAGFPVMEKEQVELDDGLLEMFLVKAPKNPVDLQNIIGAMLLRDFSGPYIWLLKIEEAHFEFEDAIPWTLDGEYGGAPTEVDVSVLPSAIAILGSNQNKTDI